MGEIQGRLWVKISKTLKPSRNRLTLLASSWTSWDNLTTLQERKLAFKINVYPFSIQAAMLDLPNSTKISTNRATAMLSLESMGKGLGGNVYCIQCILYIYIYKSEASKLSHDISMDNLDSEVVPLQLHEVQLQVTPWLRSFIAWSRPPPSWPGWNGALCPPSFPVQSRLRTKIKQRFQRTLSVPCFHSMGKTFSQKFCAIS